MWHSSSAIGDIQFSRWLTLTVVVSHYNHPLFCLAPSTDVCSTWGHPWAWLLSRCKYIPSWEETQSVIHHAATIVTCYTPLLHSCQFTACRYLILTTSNNWTYLDGSDCLNKPKRSIKVARSCCYLWPALFGLWNFKLLLNRSIKVRHLPEPGHIKLQFNKTWVFNIQLTVCVVNKMIRADGCNL